MLEFKHILVPTDFGESSERALDVAVDLCAKYGARLTVLHTYEVPFYVYETMTTAPTDLLTPVRDAAEKELERTVARVQKRLPNVQGILKMGVPWEEIQRVLVTECADLVVMGTHGRRGLTRALLGSVAEKTVRLSDVPVLTVRGPEPEYSGAHLN